MTRSSPARFIQILVAEDYQPFRRFLVSTLRSSEHEFAITEVGDGALAVQKAQELNPELVLLDIGLPILNGLEAATQIREVSPKSKILFVSQETSVDVVEEAFAVGAAAYLVKIDAGRELMVALDTVLLGDKYTSKSIRHDLPRASATAAIQGLEPASFSPKEPIKDAHRDHKAGFYSDDRFLLDDLAQFAGAGLETGKAVIVLATYLHREQLLVRLRANGFDMCSAIEQGLYTAVDVSEILSAFMRGSLPDRDDFFRSAAGLLSKADVAVNGDRRRIVALGECAPLLLEQGNADGAFQLECLWDEIARAHGIGILCYYPLDSFRGENTSNLFARICAEHSSVMSR